VPALLDLVRTSLLTKMMRVLISDEDFAPLNDVLEARGADQNERINVALQIARVSCATCGCTAEQRMLQVFWNESRPSAAPWLTAFCVECAQPRE